MIDFSKNYPTHEYKLPDSLLITANIARNLMEFDKYLPYFSRIKRFGGTAAPCPLVPYACARQSEP